MSQNFGKFANFAPDITQPIWSSKIILVFFNPEFVGCVVKTLIIQNQINICINICDLNIWTLLRYDKIKKKISSLYIEIYALSFYRFQNVLGWSNFFVPDQKFIHILWQSQTFCARQKDDLHLSKLVFVPAQKFLKRH